MLGQVEWSKEIFSKKQTQKGQLRDRPKRLTQRSQLRQAKELDLKERTKRLAKKLNPKESNLKFDKKNKNKTKNLAQRTLQEVNQRAQPKGMTKMSSKELNLKDPNSSSTKVPQKVNNPLILS